MKKLLVCCLFVVCTGNIYAVRAFPELIKFNQPDGTSVSVFLKGDEKVHWMESPDGYTLLQDENGYVVYAQKDSSDNLVPSKHVYGRISKVKSLSFSNFIDSLPKKLFYSSAQISNFKKRWENPQSRSIQKSFSPITLTPPILGKRKVLCLLVDFPDRRFTKTVEDFEHLMNDSNYIQNDAVGSVRDFYRENSYGKLDITVVVKGIYTVSHPESYYCSEKGEKYYLFAKEVIDSARKDVNFSEFAIDRHVNNLHIIFAGYGAEATGRDAVEIWSHKSYLPRAMNINGVSVSDYSCSSELRGGDEEYITPIGVICHELCHAFGADDYYDTDYSDKGYYDGTGKWDLMAEGNWNGGGTCPAHINMFQKILYGWVEPVVLSSDTTITDMPNSAKNPQAYVIFPSENNKEMYVLENRQKVGFDAKVPGEGLLIYHIHNKASQGKIDNTGHPQQAYVVCASAPVRTPCDEEDSYGYINSPYTPFAAAGVPKSDIRNAFSGETCPAMFRWLNNDSACIVTNKSLTEIKQNRDLISFHFMGEKIGTVQQPVDLNEIRIYPNPVTNELILTGYKDQEFYITNVLGLKQQNITIRSWYTYMGFDEIKIDVSHLESGIYFINTSDGRERKSLRFIKK